MSEVTGAKVQEQLKGYMDEHGLSLNSIARAVDFSNATLSQWLAGKYAGRTEDIDAAVLSFLRRQRERKQSPVFEMPFIETTVAKKVFEVARICHLDCEIGVVYGDAGLGKTDATIEYTAQNPGVLLIQADLGYTAKVLFRELHRRVGYDGVGNIHDLFDDVVARLKGSGRLIIVDEAEHLPYRALELLRRVYDKAGVGILLVGMPRLVANLRGKRGEYAQLYSRVGVAGKVELLKPEDVQKLVHTAIPGSNGLWQSFKDQSNGNTRVLVKLMRRALRISEINNVKLTPAIISESAKTLII